MAEIAAAALQRLIERWWSGGLETLAHGWHSRVVFGTHSAAVAAAVPVRTGRRRVRARAGEWPPLSVNGIRISECYGHR